MRGDALQTSQIFSFLGARQSVVVGDVVSVAAEVVSMLAEGSICQVLLTLTVIPPRRHIWRHRLSADRLFLEETVIRYLTRVLLSTFYIRT